MIHLYAAHNRLTWLKEWKKIFYANGSEKKANVAILISDRTDFNTRLTKDQERKYIVIKGSIPQEDITFVNMYVPNIGASKY